MEISTEAPQKPENRTSIFPSYTISQYSPQVIEASMLQGYLHTHIYYRSICNR